jgi:3'-phosphoadenosine 5'-phosphosulfate (PAPS) 3'-phosphatase
MQPNSPEEASAQLLRRAAQATLRVLETSQGWEQLILEEGVFHHGEDPLEVDDHAQKAFQNAARSDPHYEDLRIVDVVGEERIVRLAPLAPGERLIVLDPLDGSKPWFLVRGGYCVAALMLLADETGRLTVEAAIIASPTHAFSLIGDQDLRVGRAHDDGTNDAAVLSVVPESLTQAPSLACVAWKASERRRVMHMVDKLPGWSFLTFGGNPVTPWVITGGLTASITVKPTSTWDSIAVLMATATDAVVGDLDGTVVSGPTFRELFAAVLLEGNVTAIPPMIVAKTWDRYKEVALAATNLPPLDGPDTE